MHNTKKIVILNTFVFVAALLVVEGLFWVIEDKYQSRIDFIKSRPEPYRTSEFFTEKFISEYTSGLNGYFQIPNTSIVLPKDYHGDYINVINNRRRTVGNKGNQAKIYIFGGSTIFSIEVPDQYTIPSILQEKLNADRIKYDVINMGVSSVHSSQQLESLKTLKLKANDIVIFYDGVNEVTQRVYLGRPQGWILNEYVESPIFVRFVREFSKYSAFFRFIDDRFLTRKIFEMSPSLTYDAALAYLNAVNDANAYVTQKNATLIHVLQPNLATKLALSDYERNLIKNPNLAPWSWLDAARTSYPIFRRMLQNVPNHYDLSNAFDEVEVSPYLDICHMSEIGNIVIAEKLYKILLNNIGPQ